MARPGFCLRLCASYYILSQVATGSSTLSTKSNHFLLSLFTTTVSPMSLLHCAAFFCACSRLPCFITFLFTLTYFDGHGRHFGSSPSWIATLPNVFQR